MQSGEATLSSAHILAANQLGEQLPSHVGGREVPGSGRRLEVIDPATEDVVAHFNEGSGELVGEAVAAAVGAQRRWWLSGAVARADVLFAVAARIRAQRHDLATLESLDSGKPLQQALSDVVTAARYFEFYAGAADKFYGDAFDQASGFAYTRHEPVGVVGVITPWNSPLAQLARSLAPALAMGNAVVAKPSELTPLSSLVLGRICEQAGLPAGVLNIVLGSGITTGRALVDHPLVGHISFTGSVATGRAIGQAAGQRIIPTSLELGGKSAAIVLDDADLDAAAGAAAEAVVRNSGQSCFAATRIIAVESIHDELVERICSRFDQLTIGPGLSSPDLGPLASVDQRSRVLGYLERAIAEGAVVSHGGGLPVPDRGYYVRPHLLTEVRNDFEVAQHEIFGPVQCVIRAPDETDALAIANDSRYGLAAGVFTSSLSRAHRLAAELQAGQVQINKYPSGGVDTPFGGYKDSGIGREKGLAALHHYTQLKTVIVELGNQD